MSKRCTLCKKELTSGQIICLECATELKAKPTLEEENFNLRLKLNAEEECVVMLKKRIEELKSTIDILKDKFFIDIIERENDYKIGFLPKTPIKNGIETRFAQLDKYKGTIIKKALEIENDK